MTHASYSDTTAEITALARVLKAPRIGADYARIAEQAVEASWTYEEYLAAVLSVEASAWTQAGAEARIKRAGCPHVKTIDEFDFTSQLGID